MKLGRLTDDRFHVALQKLASQQLPLKAAFRLKGIIAKVQEEFKKYDEVRQAALEKYGKKGEDGKLVANEVGQVQFEPNDLNEFVTELDNLCNTDLDIQTVKLSELGEKVEMSAEEIMLLAEIVVE